MTGRRSTGWIANTGERSQLSNGPVSIAFQSGSDSGNRRRGGSPLCQAELGPGRPLWSRPWSFRNRSSPAFESLSRNAGGPIEERKERRRVSPTSPHHPRARRIWKLAALTTVALAVQACTAGEPAETTANLPAQAGVLLESTASVPELAAQSPTANEAAPLLPVYWIGENNGLLYREFIPVETAADPIAAAVWAMTSAEPLDEDYYSPWQTASAVNTSISPDNVITVDISSDSFASEVSADVAGRAVQQLVYTATAAAASSGQIASGSPSSVRLLVDGKAGFVAFGHIGLGALLHRDVSAVAPVWIINPQDGSIPTDRTVIIDGSTMSTLPALEWRVRRVDGAGVAAEDVPSGSAPVEAGTGSVSLFEFSVTLEPGTYLVEVFEPSPDGSGGGSVDDKLISIR